MHFFRLPISPNMEIFGCYKASTPADSAWIGSAAQDVRAHESSSHRWSSLHQSWCQQSVPWQRLTTDIWHKIFKYTVVLAINSYIPSDITLYNSYIPLYTIWYNIIYHYITEYTLCDMFFFGDRTNMGIQSLFTWRCYSQQMGLTIDLWWLYVGLRL
jgi:hypothetical protein